MGANFLEQNQSAFRTGVGQCHGVFVAADASDDGVGGQAAAEGSFEAAQYGVSGWVSERVVDFFEVIQVEQAHGDGRAFADWLEGVVEFGAGVEFEFVRHRGSLWIELELRMS